MLHSESNKILLSSIQKIALSIEKYKILSLGLSELASKLLMFTRISRLISSFFNRFISQVEDPQMILENNIQEMQAQIPKLNESVARSHGAVIMLQKQLGKYLEDTNTLDSQVKAALKLGDENAARDIVVRLTETRSKQEKTGKDLELAQQNLNQTQAIRDLKVKEIKDKINEIKGAVEEHKYSQMLREIVQVSDESASIDNNNLASSTTEMLNRLNQTTAVNQGTFAASLSNKAPELQAARIEKEAKLIEADELLLKYKKDLGLSVKSATQNADVIDVEIK